MASETDLVEADVPESTTLPPSEIVGQAEAGDQVIPERDVAAEADVVETSIVPQTEIAGQTVIDDGVVGAIVGTAAQEIEGVASLGSSSVRRMIAEQLGGAQRRARGVGVVTGQREAIVDLEINVFYGSSIPDVTSEVRNNVYSRVLDLCGLVTKEINITVAGIEFVYGHPSPFARME